MSLLKCDQCGEMYSDSYRSCPFCEEDAAYYSGGKSAAKRQRLARQGKKNTPGVIGPALILVMLLIIALPIWAIFGDNIRYAITGETPPVEDSGLVNLDTPKPDDSDLTPTVELTMPGTLLLALDESKQLEITGGTSYTWTSSNPNVAIVSENGTVKAVTEGSTTVTATDVSGKAAVCAVTVTKDGAIVPEPVTPNVNPNGNGTTTTTPQGPTKPTVTTVDVSKLKVTTTYGTTITPSDGIYDVQLDKNASFQLFIEGTDVTPKWSSDNSERVTVSSDGTITWKSRNTDGTNVYADLNGVKLTFLVRTM